MMITGIISAGSAFPSAAMNCARVGGASFG
jgi:hypothetical protein